MQIDRNVSTLFLLPPLKINAEDLNIEKHGFLNAYQFIKGEENPDKEELYLLFNPSNIERFNDFLDGEYFRTDSILDDYDVDGFVVVVYKLDNRYKDDFELIRQGKYSKTSKEFQSLFSKIKKTMKEGRYKDEVSIQWKIFNKSEDLREFWEELIGQPFKAEMEVWSTFEIEKETLDFEKIKQLL